MFTWLFYISFKYFFFLKFQINQGKHLGFPLSSSNLSSLEEKFVPICASRWDKKDQFGSKLKLKWASALLHTDWLLNTNWQNLRCTAFSTKWINDDINFKCQIVHNFRKANVSSQSLRKDVQNFQILFNLNSSKSVIYGWR